MVIQEAFSKFPHFVTILPLPSPNIILVTIPKWRVIVWHLVVKFATISCFPMPYIQSGIGPVDPSLGTSCGNKISGDRRFNPLLTGMCVLRTSCRMFVCLWMVSTLCEGGESIGWLNKSESPQLVQGLVKIILHCRNTESCSHLGENVLQWQETT